MLKSNRKSVSANLALVLVFALSLSCSSRDDVADGGVAGWVSTEVHLDPKAFFDLITENRKNPAYVLLDVRTPVEFNNEHLENAGNLDYLAGDFREEIDKLDRSKTYMIYCRSGNRSSKAFDLMGGMGFSNLYELKGGIIAWKKNGLPVSADRVKAIP